MFSVPVIYKNFKVTTVTILEKKRGKNSLLKNSLFVRVFLRSKSNMKF